MIRKKHESSLLEVFSDVGSTPTASTIPSIEIVVRHSAACLRRDGKQQRQSAKTRSWKIVEERRRKIEAQFETADPTKPIRAVTVESKGEGRWQQHNRFLLSWSGISFRSLQFTGDFPPIA